MNAFSPLDVHAVNDHDNNNNKKNRILPTLAVK